MDDLETTATGLIESGAVADDCAWNAREEIALSAPQGDSARGATEGESKEKSITIERTERKLEVLRGIQIFSGRVSTDKLTMNSPQRMGGDKGQHPMIEPTKTTQGRASQLRQNGPIQSRCDLCNPPVLRG